MCRGILITGLRCYGAVVSEIQISDFLSYGRAPLVSVAKEVRFVRVSVV
jgi:hypothetical protein